MRRTDREVTDSRAIERFIARQRILRIGFCDRGEVYIVPVNYGYEIQNGAYTFYFHGARAGRKYALAQASPRVGFEIDGAYSLLTAEQACGYSARYQSVVGSGILSIVSDSAEKTAALDCLMRQLTGTDGFTYTGEALNAAAVFKLTVTHLSCKASGVTL